MIQPRHLRRIASVLVAGALIGGLAAVASADDVDNDLDTGSVDATAEVVAVSPSGANALVGIRVDATNAGSSNGCDLSLSATLVLNVVNSNPAVASVSPSTLTFTTCTNQSGVYESLTVDPLAPGVAQVTFTKSAASTAGGSFVLAGGAFVVNVDDAPTFVSSAPANTAVNVPVGTNVSVTYSEAINVEAGHFTLTCGGLAQAFTLSGQGTSTLTLDPSADLPSATSCTATINEGKVHDSDTIDPPDDAGTGSRSVTFTTTAAALCPPGSYSATGREPCTLATVGYYVQNAGATSASPAPLGYYVDTLGAVSATAAPLGFYVNSTAATAATACAAGYTTLSLASTSSAACVPITPLDTTPPVIEYTVNGNFPAVPDGLNGWYRNNAALVWKVTDNESPNSIVLTGCGDTTVNADQQETEYSCSARSDGGPAQTVTVKIKRDATAPTISAAVTPDRPASGWWNFGSGAPTVAFTCGDLTSGVVSCPNAHTFGEGEDQARTGTVFDDAGNSNSAGVIDIDVDLTAPTISAAVTPDRPASGWWNFGSGAPTVAFTCGDLTSGVVSCPVAYTFGEGEDQPRSGTVFDDAGNSNSAGVIDIDVDLTAPTISAAVAPDRPASGWWNIGSGAPTVSYECSDSLSGAAICSPDETFGEGADQTARGDAIDSAGNSSSASVSNIDVDLTAPTISAAVAPDRPASGWWNIGSGAPTAAFTCGDPTSGVLSCPNAHTFGEGENQARTGTVFDNAGNSSSAGVSDIDVDLTAPTVSLVGGPADGASYYFGTVPSSPTCNAADVLSGLDGSCSLSGYGLAVGQHTVVATARDLAGNPGLTGAEADIAYTVLAWTLKGFYQPVDMGGVLNTVKNGSTVPLKFEVFAGPIGSNEMTTTAAVVSFTQQRISCEFGPGLEDAIETTTTGQTTLRYDSTGGQFIQNWQTPKIAGACFKVTMTTQDLSTLVAYFKLK